MKQFFLLLIISFTFSSQVFSQIVYREQVNSQTNSITDLDIESNENIFTSALGVFRSTDNSTTRSYAGPSNGGVNKLTTDDKIFPVTSNASYRFDPSDSIYVGNNYLPLNIGNKWQFLGREIYYFNGSYYYGYWLTEIEVTRDTIINGIIYYGYLNEWARYSEDDKKIYVWYDNTEKVHMDLTLEPEVSFLQFPLPYNSSSIFNNRLDRIATFKHGFTTIFNMPLNYKGFSFDSSYFGIPEYEECNYIEEIGPYYFYLETENYLRDNSLIMAILNDSMGNQINYSNNHKPQIALIPLTLVSSNNFSLIFLVEHAYSKITWNFSFVDTVYMESYYQRNDSIIYKENILASRVTISSNYNVTALLDTNLLKDNFEFYYRIIAKDKGIIAGITYSPESGYYKCTWHYTTDVADERDQITDYKLIQNYPNPFNPNTKISWQSPVGSWQTIKVFDVLGREVATLVDEYREAGYHEVEFNSSGLASGVYYYQLKAGSNVETKKMVLLR